jgi:methylenetetrahydrofolate--tRNA-(uracil-5-)-methyltransferase
MIRVIGAGLAGTEATWQIAAAGLPVQLIEMRPVRRSPAHHSGECAELVCSNSFGSLSSDRAAGLLQEELRRLGSVVIRTADAHAVPAGGALAVDRGRYSAALTAALEAHPLVTLERQEQDDLPPSSDITVLATGPLTAEPLAERLRAFTGRSECHFFDAASPIVEGDSIDLAVAFRASRYDKGDADYINCPMDRAQYLAFRQALLEAEKAELKDFEQDSATFFEGCLPIEELARRGEDTMRYGPLKPIGLWDPRWGDLHDRDVRRARRAYAVAQLRQEDRDGRLWNLVGFQTNLKWGEQKRVLRMIPGLEKAEFVRFGVMHRNTFLEAPQLLDPTLQFRRRPTLLAAGQITGTEGYAAAVAGGWLAGTNAARLARGLSPPQPAPHHHGRRPDAVHRHGPLWRGWQEGPFPAHAAQFRPDPRAAGAHPRQTPPLRRLPRPVPGGSGGFRHAWRAFLLQLPEIQPSRQDSRRRWPEFLRFLAPMQNVYVMAPQVRAAFENVREVESHRLVGRIPVRDVDVFWLRFERYFDDLYYALSALYGERHDAFTYFGDLFGRMVEAYGERPDPLKVLDLERQFTPRWFQRSHMVGYTAYADHFAGTLRDVRERIDYLQELGITYLHLMPLMDPRHGPSDGGYAVRNYRRVRVDLGTIGDLHVPG